MAEAELSTREHRNEQVLTASTRLDQLGRRTVNGSTIAFAANFVRLVISLASSAILARLVSPGDFGLIAMSTTVTAFASMFTDLGLSAVTIQRAELNQRLVSALVKLNLLAGLVLFVLASLVAPVAAWFYGEPRLTAVIICIALAIPVAALGTQHMALLSRSMRWVPAQVAVLGGQLAGAIVAILLVYGAQAGYWGLAAQPVAAALVTTTIYWLACDWRPTWRVSFRDATDEILFGARVTAFSLVDYMHRQFDNILIGLRRTNAELGHYNRAYNLLIMTQLFVSAPVNSVLMSLLSRSRDDPAIWRANFLNAATLIALTNGLMGTIVICCGSAIVYTLYGPQWDLAARTIMYLSPAIVLSGNFALGTLMMARGDTTGLLRSVIINTALYGTGFIIAVDHGVTAVAFAYSLVTLITLPITVHIALKDDVVRQHQYYRAIVPFILICPVVVATWHLGFGGFATRLSLLALIGQMMLAGSAYLLLSIVFFMVDPAQASLRDRLGNYLRNTLRMRASQG